MKRFYPYLALIVIFILFIVMYVLGYQSNKITIDDPSVFNNWMYQNQEITLPTELDVDKHTPYTISHLLDEDFHEPKYLLIRTSLSNVSVYLDDTLIYEEIYGTSLLKPFASMWHVVELPRHIDGSTLSITFLSPYEAMSGQINEVFYGSEVMHFSYLVRTYGMRFLVSSMIFLIGLIVMVSSFFMAKNQEKDKGFAYAGLFAILLSQWMMAESRMLQFFTGSELLIGSLAYIVLPLFPIPLIIYLRDQVLTRFSKTLNLFAYIFIFQFILVVGLYVFNIMDFFETVIITQIILGITMSITVYFLVVETKESKNQNALNSLKLIIFLAVLGGLEILNFALGNFGQTSSFLTIGLAVLSIIILINYGKYLIQRVKISHENEVYEKLAFMDHITQGQNRLAFERDLENIYLDEEKRNKLRLIMFDLDNLKKINDVYGHVEGDQAIKKAFEMISEVFLDHGICYRIGGDEFACLYLNQNQSLFEEKKRALEVLMDAFEDETPYHFGLSLGSSLYNKDNKSQTALIHEADIDMYEYKKTYKKALHEEDL